MKRSPYKYKEEFCEDLIRHMSQGYSYTTWGVSHDISTSAMYKWENEHPEWLDAKKRGYAAGQIFFEKLLMSASMGIIPENLKKIESKGINLSAVIFALKTRFHKEYSEKIEVDNTSSDGSMKVTFVKPPVEEGEDYEAKVIETD